MEKKRYLLFASHAYSYAIMRPLQEEIRRQGHDVAWFLEDTCPDQLMEGERRLMSIEEAIAYDPLAVIVPGNWVYDFLPGIKVQVFHGYPVEKRGEKVDGNFKMRGWFDMYCSPGPSSSRVLMPLERRLGYFKTYETGWPGADAFARAKGVKRKREGEGEPTILYAPTFTRSVSSAWVMAPVIEELAKTRKWRWIFSFHPLLQDPEVIARYEDLAERYDNIEFRKADKGVDRFLDSDVMLADNSAVICQYMMFDKPVVTYRNTRAGNHLIDCRELDEIPAALERALNPDEELRKAMRDYTHDHEAFCDGRNSERILAAIDDFAANYRGRLRRKPLNLFRKLKLRRRLGYWKW